MATTFAALLFRPEDIPERALSLGFAVSLGGWDAPSPRLSVTELPGLPGWSVAFYSSGIKDADDDFQHSVELFEDELSPPVAVLDAAASLGSPNARVFALLYSEDVSCDDGTRVDPSGFCRHFVREGDDGLEWGVETQDQGSVSELPADLADDDDPAARERAIKPHRGSTFLSSELRAPVLAALIAALFGGARRVAIHLVEPSPESIGAQTERLVAALGRTIGRGAFAPPVVFDSLPPPACYLAFVSTYDWSDPRDPKDLYRELSIGLIEGTLRFLRAPEIEAEAADPALREALLTGLYPVAKLVGSSLQASHARTGIVALSKDGESLFLLTPHKPTRLAGPTFGELLGYLTLGWSKRTDAEEDWIGALMLKARVRIERTAPAPGQRT